MNVSRETSVQNVQKQVCAVKDDIIYLGWKYKKSGLEEDKYIICIAQ